MTRANPRSSFAKAWSDESLDAVREAIEIHRDRLMGGV
jgi:hypothetical protein